MQKVNIVQSDIKIMAALGLLAIVGLLFFGNGWTGGLATGARDKALSEMGVRLGLMEGAGSVYVDEQTQAATLPARARDYAEGLKRAYFHDPAAFVADAGLFSATIERRGGEWLKGQKQGRTWQDVLPEEMRKNILRALIVPEKGGTAYYFLMPTNAADPVLVGVFGTGGVKRRLRGSYGDVVPFRRELRRGWYLLFAPPGQPADFSALAREKSLRLRYAGTNDWMVSVALFEAPKDVVLSAADSSIFLMPLLEGWKEN